MVFSSFTPKYYSDIIKRTISDLNSGDYYCYLADGVTQEAVENNDPKSVYDEQQIIRKLLYGTKLNSDNIIPLIRRINWTSGSVYQMYNSKNPNQETSNFYVLTSARRVYICLDNSKGTPSLYEPDFIDSIPTRLGDGYVWKYMYSLTSNQLTDYASTDFIPIFEDNSVLVEPGMLTSVEVLTSGEYSTYHGGLIQQVISPTRFRIESTASTFNQIYKDSSLYISLGSGQGSIAKITNSFSNSGGIFIDVDTPLSTVTIGNTYEIAPTVLFSGDGSGASARAVVTNNFVTSIEILRRGNNYTYITSSLQANPSYSNAGTLNPILSPINGFNSDISADLFASHIMINVELDNIVTDLPIDKISFCKTGILKNLKDFNDDNVVVDNFSNVAKVSLNITQGTFEVGDSVVNPQGLKAYVVSIDNNDIYVVYQQKDSFEIFENIISQNNAIGSITAIVQPDVNVSNADILSISNLDTLRRDSNSRETMQFVIKIR